MTVASALLLLFGLLSAGLVVNARAPRYHWWSILLRWPAAWLARELTPMLVVGGLVVTVVLVALGALGHPTGIAGAALVAAAAAVGVVWSLHARGARVAVAGAVAEMEIEDDEGPRVPRSHVALPLLMLRPKGVDHVRGVAYTTAGDERPRRLDVYAPAPGTPIPDGRERRPAIVQVHGGGWVLGSRREQGIPLLNHLARCGWVGFNIDYRLSPFATWPEHVVDVKRAIAWVREHADEYDVDPSFVAITGGSAGGHITALTALTGDDASLQPGFEDADCSVQAAVPFYGVYDLLDEERTSLPLLHPWVLEPLVLKKRRTRDPDAFRAASPIHRVHPGAPPFMVIHGDADSLIPVVQARAFADRLRETSRAAVAYVELRGGEHAFDILPSWRSIPVIETIERFLATTHAHLGESTAAVEREVEIALTDEDAESGAAAARAGGT